MSRPVTANYNGKNVPATSLDFESINDEWNEYRLEDGTTLKLRTVVAEIVSIDGKKSADGSPVYQVKSGNVLHIEVP